MDEKERQKLIETIQGFCLLDDTYFNVYMDGFPEVPQP